MLFSAPHLSIGSGPHPARSALVATIHQIIIVSLAFYMRVILQVALFRDMSSMAAMAMDLLIKLLVGFQRKPYYRYI